MPELRYAALRRAIFLCSLRSLFIPCLSALLGLVPAVGRAQAPYYAPRIQITPGSHVFVTTQTSLAITVYWCGDQYGWDASTQLVKVNNVIVPKDSFTVDINWTATGCVYHESWSGTIPLGPGITVVKAQAWSLPDPNNYYYADFNQVTATYTPAASSRGVTVTSSTQLDRLPPAWTTSPVFTITNTGERTDTFNLTFSCVNPKVGLTCTPSTTDPAILAPGAQGTVTVSVPVTATTGGVTRAAVRATAATASGITDSAYSEYTATALQAQPVVLARDLSRIERSLCTNISVRGGAAVCGDLVLAHTLPASRTMNTVRAPTLVYNSRLAAPWGVVQADVSMPSQPVDSVTAALVFDDVQVSAAKWAGTDFPNARSRRIGLSWNATGKPTGVYTYTLTVRKWVGITPTTLGTPLTGDIIIVNREASPFGVGWWLGGVERLQTLSTLRLLWVGGDGSARIYSRASTSDSTWRAANLAAPDSITHSLSGPYRRHLSGGGYVEFDASRLLHRFTRPRVGNSTSYVYDTTDVRYPLTRIWVRTQTENDTTVGYRFHYGAGPAGTLDTVTLVSRFGTPITRQVAVGRDTATKRILLFIDPDLSTVAFTYQAAPYANRVASRRDQRGHTTTYLYAARAQTLSTISVPNGVGADTTKLTDAWTRGIRDATGGSGAVVSDAWDTQIDGPRTDVADLTHIWVNNVGAPTRVRDPLGNEQTVAYSTTWPGLATDTRAGTGVSQTASYDAVNGLLQSTVVRNVRQFGDSAITTYSWNPQFRAPLWVKAPLADTIHFSYTSQGLREWEQPGQNSARRTTYRYNAHGQVQAVVPPGITAGKKDSVVYDALGNVDSTISPKGFVSWSRLDALGRPVATGSPIDSAGRRDSTAYTYDLGGRVILTRTLAARGTSDPVYPAQLDTMRDVVIVESTYDAGGLALTNRRKTWNEDGTLVDLLTTFGYDTLGRMVRETSMEKGSSTMRYDAAGNVVARTDGRSLTVTTEFDAASRPTRVKTPAVVQGPINCTPRGAWGCFFTFPSYGSQVCAPADYATFSYDKAGNIVRADNRYARIRRTYTPGGLLATDTLRIRTYYSSVRSTGSACEELNPTLETVSFTFPPDWGGGGGQMQQQTASVGDGDITSSGGTMAPMAPGGGGGGSSTPLPVADADFNSHVYVLRYHYDAAGRRDTLYNLVTDPCGACSVARQSYAYDFITGSIASMTDILGTVHTATYDVAGRLSTTVSPGWSVTRGYDDEGNLVSHPTGPIIRYDPRGRVISGVDTIGNTFTNQYGGFGPLLHTVGTSATVGEETFTYTPLGGRRSARQVPTDYIPPVDDGLRQDSVDINDRLLNRARHLDNFEFSEAYAYDGAGSQTHVTGSEWQLAPYHEWYWETQSTYGGENKLRFFDSHAGFADHSDDNNSPGHPGSFEEYRYDALGRRVLVRSRHPGYCSGSVSTCWQYIQRTVWDGDQALNEIRAPGVDSTPAYNMERDSVAVAYTHMMGIDNPVSVIKANYGVVPHANWRGAFIGGSRLSDGAQMPNCQTGWCPNIHWGGRYEAADGNSRTGDPHTIGGMFFDWFGTLIDGGADGSGLKYMRNRYYDPGTGRFTQADPIGLAGGLNLYGYAGGDPFTYSDPLGLCTVNVRYSGLGKFLGKKRYHAYIVTTSPGGERTVFRGGPTNQAGPGSSAGARTASGATSGQASGSQNSESSNSAASSNSASPGASQTNEGRSSGAWGDIQTKTEPYGPGSADYPDAGDVASNGYDMQQAVYSDGGSCKGLNNSFAATLQDIQNAHISYNPITTNSNATVGSMLRNAGIKATPIVSVPGFGIQIP